MKNADIAVVSALVLAFAVLVTAHLCVVAGLLRRAPRWRAAAALVLAPLAPYWAFRERMYWRGGAWVAGAVAYAIALGVAK